MLDIMNLRWELIWLLFWDAEFSILKWNLIQKAIDFHQGEASSSRAAVEFTQDVEVKIKWELIKADQKKCFGFYVERGLSISSIQSIIITQQSHIQWTYTMIQV